MKIGLLHMYRQRVGLTQKQLADAIGLTQAAVAKIESGGGLKAETAYALARALETHGLDFVEVLTALSNPATRTLTVGRKKKPGTAIPGNTGQRADPPNFLDKESIADGNE